MPELPLTSPSKSITTAATISHESKIQLRYTSPAAGEEMNAEKSGEGRSRGGGDPPSGSEKAVELSLHFQERAPQDFVKSRMSAHSTPDLKRMTAFGDRGGYFWSSLPASSRTFVIISGLDVLLVLVYALWQFKWFRKHVMQFHEDSETCVQACAEHQHVVLAMLVTAFFFITLVWDSILHENDFGLLASMGLSAVVTGRVVFFLFTADVRTYSMITGLVLSLSFESLTIIFAYMTYRKFGWRVYSKIACDLRLKNAEERRNLYFKFHRFRTLVKLDLQFLTILAVTGITMAIMLKSGDRSDGTRTVEFTSSSNMTLLLSTAIGCVVGLAWLGLAYVAVRREKLGLVTFLEFTCLLTFGLPVLTVVSVYASSDRSAWEGKESLFVATALYILTRIAVWVNMRSILREAKAIRMEGEWNLNDKQEDTNPDLLPMLKGAWLIKPSPQTPKKRRFFQLSQDHTTLRWAWNKYVILYYVDELRVDDKSLTITLLFSMDPDLVLKFKHQAEYDQWKRGFTLLLTMLMVPNPENDPGSLQKGDGRSMMNINYNKQPTNVLQKFLNVRLGITTTRSAGKKLKHRTPRTSAPVGQNSQNSASGSITNTPGEINQGPQYRGEQVSVAPGRFKVIMPDHLVQAPKPSQQNGVGDKPDLESLSAPDPKNSESGFGMLTGTESPIVPAQNKSLIHGIGLQMPVPVIEHDDLEIGKFLGAGAEGAVWAAWYQETPVAVKKTDSLNELEIIVSANQHDNVVGFRGISRTGSSRFLVMEYCPRGTLDVMLHHTQMQRWDLTKVLQMVRGIARGMLHLHTRKPSILHRDLKPGNIFIGHGLVMKIGDFGMSRHVHSDDESSQTELRPRLNRQFTTGVVGTPAYSAPELTDEQLQCSNANPTKMLKADVYSFGVCLWEIVERERPFSGMTYYQIATQWLRTPADMELPNLTMPKDATKVDRIILNACQELVVQCTRRDPDKRPDFKTILKRLKGVHNEIRTEGVAAV